MAEGNSGADALKQTKSKTPDYRKLEELGFSQCTLEDAAIIMGRANYQKPFGARALAAYHKGRAAGLNALREAQLGMAKKSTAMATMLGRRYLDQPDQREQNESGPIDYARIKKRHRDKVRDILFGGKEDAD